MRPSWLRDFARRVFGMSPSRRGTIRRRNPAERQPTLEALETRLVPSTITVTNTNDTGAGSLRNAVAQANANTGPDAIVFDNTVFNAPQTITLTSGPITFTDTATTTVTGPGAGLLSVSGNNASRVFFINSSVSVSMSDLTITGGNATGAGSAGSGGGLFNQGAVTLANVTVTGNTSSGNGGGGVGGALYNHGTATLTDCTVSSNTGFGVDTPNAPNTTTLINCTVSNNSKNGLELGGGSTTLTNCTISGNSAGGGVRAYLTNLTINDCTVSGNTDPGGTGGGVQVRLGSFSMTNSTVTGNSAALGGGLNLNPSGTYKLTDCTISGNTASSQGGGVWSNNSPIFVNTIVAGNTGPTGPDVYDTSAVTSDGYNLIGKTDGSSGWVGTDLTGTIASPLNALLAPLGNNGGPTQTMLPQAGSPAIGAGNNTGGPATDQRGFPRLTGAGGNIGAVEAALFTVTTNADSGAGSLRADITTANSTPGGSIIRFAAALSGDTITLAGTALPSITGNLQIRGLGASQLTVSGNNASGVFTVNSGATAIISGLTITAATGGAVNDSGSVSLTDSAITASAGGGFNLVDFTAGTATLTNVRVSNNLGIGVHNGGNGGHVTLVNCTVSGNTGAGIDTQRYPNTTLVNTTVSGNGGVGIVAFGNSVGANGNLTVTNSTVSNNAGGGLWGIINATVTNTTIAGNSAANGAGVSWAGHTISLVNSTISGNNASSQGGGLRLSGSGAATVTNTIIAGNTATTSGPDVFGTVTSQGHNLIGKTDGSSGWGGTDLQGTVLSPLNAHLASLGYYGGPTQTMPLQPSSPALGAGNPAAGGLPTTDQRGFARAVSGAVDIGAFQTQALPYAVTTADDTVTGAEPVGELSLRNAITLADALAPAGGASIRFAIPTSDAGYNSGTGIYTIAPAATLPTITARIGIDGTTQAGYTTTPVIQLNGSVVASPAPALTITAANSSVKGLTIVAFGGDGVLVSGAAATGVTVRGNLIYNNAGLGIHLAGGANRNVAAPTLVAFRAGASTVLSGTFGNTAGVTFLFDGYANPAATAGSGQFSLGGQQVTTGAGGAFTLTLPGATTGSQFVSATATDASGDTSQFAADVAPNTNPIVAIGAPTGAIAGAPVSLTSTLTDTTAGKTYTYAWSVTQTGNPAFSLPADAITDEPTLVFIPPAPGSYVAHLVVSDSLGGSGATASLSFPVSVPGPGVVIQGAPGNLIAANTAVSFTSTVTEPTGATPTSYTWGVTLNHQPYSLPAGTPVHGTSFAFTPGANGLYQISLTVSDSAGGTTTTSVFVTVAASGQAATIYNVPRTGSEGSPVAVKGAGNPNLTAPYTYNWAVYKNGAASPFFAAPADSTGAFAFTPDAPGLYQATLVITDSHGHTAAAFPVTVPVTAVPPTPQVLSFPASATAGQHLTLAGTATSAGAADPVVGLTWVVTSSNGQVTATGAGATLNYTPSVAGTDVVTLTAVTASGARGSRSVQIAVAPATTLSVTAPSPLLEGTPGRLTAVVNNPHAGSYIFVWTVTEQGNSSSLAGTASGTSPTSNFDFTPPATGAYLVTVSATDASDNSTVSVGPLTFQAANVAPSIQSITVSPSAPSEGAPVTLSAAVSDPGLPGDALNYQWAVTGPDGFVLNSSGATPKFTPNESGSYAVTLTVTDSGGAPSAPLSTSFSVAHVAPTLAIRTAAGTGVSGSTVTANLTAVLGNDPGDDEAGQPGTAYTWAVSPAPLSSSSNRASFTFTGNAGTSYQVTLTVTDDDGDRLTAVVPFVVYGAGTTKTLTSSDVPAGATQLVAVTQGGSKVNASAVTVPVVLAAVGTGHDSLVGGAGASVLVGDSGFNSLVAGSGPTTLIATQGDTLVGGSGSNLFALNAGAGEVVQAGTSGSNTLSFAPSGTGVLATLGANPVAQFGTGTGATSVALSGTFQSLIGGSGNDTLMSGGASGVYLQAGTGNAQLIASGGTSVTLFGGTGNDTLSSSGGTSISMVSGGGNDTMTSSGGSSITLFGGTGNDSLSSTGGTGVTLVSGGGNDTLTSSGGSSITLFGSTGNDTLSSTGGTSISMVSGGGNDTMTSSGDSSITMFGGTGNDSLSATGGTSVTLVSGGGNDTLSSTGGSSITLFGGTGNDSLSSSGGTSVSMVSGGGNDTLSSTGGSSITLFGGTGNDSLSSTGGTGVTLVSGGGNDTMTSSGGSSITLFGGTGNDSLSSSGGTSVSMVSGGGNDTLSSTGGSSVTMFGGTGNDSLSSTGGTGVTLVSGGGNDTLSSSGGSSITLFGGTGSDSLSSSGGTSISMVSGGGNDTMTSTGGSSVTMFGGTGNDTLSSTGGTGVTLVAGTGNDSLSSSGGSNALLLGSSVTLFGGTGNDTLSSTGGTSVTLVGGSGNDSLSSSGGSSITMFGGSGNDTLSSTGGTSVSMVAGSGNDTLASTGGSSVTLFGGTGNDSLSASGGTGVTMVGGAGNSTLSASDSADALLLTNSGAGTTAVATVSGGSSITMFGGAGNDTLSSSGGTSITMVAGSGTDTLSSTGGTGVLIQGGVVIATQTTGGSSITMFGGTGNDSLSSSGGTSVTMIGGSGNDTLSSTAGSSVTMFGGTGNDSLSSSGGTGVSMIGGSGNSTLSSSGGSSITLFGGTGNDSLSSSGGTSVTMVGGSGNSTLSSSGGSSITMFGGTGNDSLSSSGGTSVSLVGGSGNDTLSSTGGSSVTLFGGSGNDSLSSTGGTNVTMVGGSGNSTLASSGGSSITMFGGTGNDSLSSSGGSSVTMIGGSGNDTLSSTGGSSVTMFGGTSNDSLSSSGGTNITVTGGSGNDTLSSTGGTGVTLQGGGAGNDSLSSSGGTSITMFGGSGNDTLTANGGTGVGLYGLQGNNVYNIVGPITVSLNDLNTFGQQVAQTDSLTPGVNTIAFPGLATGVRIDLSNTSPGPAPQLPTDPGQPQTVAPGIVLSLTGQFQNVVGTPGDDWIHGDAASNVLDGGGTGNDTLVGGGGPATLVAGSGTDSLVAGSGGTTFRFAGAPASLGNVTVDPPAGSALNVLDFSQFAGPVSVNLASAGPQTVSGSSGLSLTLQDPAEINGVRAGAFATNVVGNAAGDTFYVGTGNDTFTGGGGADTFFFSGSPAGSDSITETSGGNTLNFYGLAAPVTLSLLRAEAGVAQPVSGRLTLTLSDPSAYGTVVGTPYNDVIAGNETANQALVGGGGADSLAAGDGNDLLQGNVTQVVFLDFTSTPAGDHLYTAAEQAAILRGMQQDYAAFNYFFTLDPSAARQQAAATGGQYVTIEFNAGNAGGASNVLDPGNLDLGGRTVVNVNPFLGTSAGLVPPTSANIVGLSTTIAAHELGHQSGLQHQDAFGPIGSGLFGGVGGEFYPTLPAGQGAPETPQDIMASPASVGTTLLQAAAGTYVGARDAIKLAFNDSGAAQAQQGLPTENVNVSGVLPPAVVLPAGVTDRGFSITQASVLGVNGNLPSLAVPNTLARGARDYGLTLDVTALAVNGTLASNTQQDFYAFNAQAGQVMTFQVISNNDTLNPNRIIPELLLVGPDGTVLGYNVHEFEAADSTLMDVTLPQNGTYYVGVDSLLGLTAGNYQLFLYSYATSTVPASAGGDTLVGGGGNDTILGSSANDVITFAPNSAGSATVNPGSGNDVVSLFNAPNEAVTAATAATDGVTPLGTVTVQTQQITPTAQVTGTGGTANGFPAQTGGTTGASSFAVDVTWATPAAIAYGTALSGTQLDASASVAGTFTYSTGGLPIGTGTVLGAGTYTLLATFTPNDTSAYPTVTQKVQLVVNKATPVVTWAAPGAITYGTALSATQLDAGASVAGTFTYNPAASTVLTAGTQTLSVTFTPFDTANYNPVTQTVQLVVNKATPAVTWATPGAITYGTALSATQLDAGASVAGTFTYAQPGGTVLTAGTHTLSVSFTPTDTANYNTVTQTVQIVVSPVTPTVSWATPAGITYGTALSAAQLNASASVAGTFVYDPAPGTVPTAGTQTLSVTFFPNDAIDYTTVSTSVQLAVARATPVITWNNPSAITYGTALSGAQLNARANVLGTFAYSPAAGTVLGAGTQTLSTTFTPTDTADYDPATQTAQLVVNPAILTVTANPATKVFNTPNPSFTYTLGGFVNGDSAGVVSGSPSLSSTATTASPVGAYPITAALGSLSAANYTFNFVSGTLTVTLTPPGGTSVFVLSPSAAGAVSVSGSAQLTTVASGPLDVNSRSSSALAVSGTAQVSAGSIQVVGGVQKGSGARISPNPITGTGTFGDPLVNLPVPDASAYNLTAKGAVSVSGNNSLSISQGIYTQVSVSGSGKLTMGPGIYVIAGGGFSVTGNGSVSGNGVVIYNAGSNYLGSSNTPGVVNISGNGTVSLTAPTSGAYAGILIFQSRDNTNTVALSGNGITGSAGAIYAPAAALTISGSGRFNGSIVANTLSLCGNAIAQLTAADGVTAVYSPAQVRTAYGVNNLSLDGTGQTIAVVDAYDNPAISQALDAFDAQFALTDSGSALDQLYGPASSFLTVVNQRGDVMSPPATDPAGVGADNWEMESALDVEWAHAAAPGAKIVLVEADSQSLSDLMTAARTAAGLPGVSVVSMSWGFVEGVDVLAADEAAYDDYLTTPAGHQGVTFVASTGDYGAAVPLYPATSPNVVAVGGTSLILNADNSYSNEVGWGSYSNALGLFLGSGGGLSQFEAEPAFQQGVQSTGSRTGPDVSLLADPATGAWIADPYNLSGDDPWEMVGGTSLSAPAWGSLFALVDQGRAASGKATLGSAGPTEAQAALYGLNRADFHDITSGSNGYSAGPGYDLVSGLGSPVTDLLVADLVAFADGPPSATPVAPIAPAGLVPSSDLGSVDGAVEALARAAALRVFSAASVGARVGGPASAIAFEEATPGTAVRTPPAVPGRGAFAGGSGASAPIDARARPGDVTEFGLNVAVEAAALTGRAVAPEAGRRNGSSPGAGGAPAWSAVLLDAPSAMGLVPALMAGALRPEMPVDGATDVLFGGAGDDLLVGGEGHDLLVGGYAPIGPEAAPNSRPEDDAWGPPWFGDPDAYFVRMGQGDEGASTGSDDTGVADRMPAEEGSAGR